MQISHLTVKKTILICTISCCLNSTLHSQGMAAATIFEKQQKFYQIKREFDALEQEGLGSSQMGRTKRAEARAVIEELRPYTDVGPLEAALGITTGKVGKAYIDLAHEFSLNLVYMLGKADATDAYSLNISKLASRGVYEKAYKSLLKDSHNILTLMWPIEKTLQVDIKKNELVLTNNPEDSANMALFKKGGEHYWTKLFFTRYLNPLFNALGDVNGKVFTEKEPATKATDSILTALNSLVNKIYTTNVSGGLEVQNGDVVLASSNLPAHLLKDFRAKTNQGILKKLTNDLAQYKPIIRTFFESTNTTEAYNDRVIPLATFFGDGTNRANFSEIAAQLDRALEMVEGKRIFIQPTRTTGTIDMQTFTHFMLEVKKYKETLDKVYNELLDHLNKSNYKTEFNQWVNAPDATKATKRVEFKMGADVSKEANTDFSVKMAEILNDFKPLPPLQ